MTKDEKEKDVKATQSWESFKNFALNLIQVKTEEVKQLDAEIDDIPKDHTFKQGDS